jgi:hypothetical protein
VARKSKVTAKSIERKGVDEGKMVRFTTGVFGRLVGEVVDRRENNVIGVFTWKTGRVYLDARSVTLVKERA